MVPSYLAAAEMDDIWSIHPPSKPAAGSMSKAGKIIYRWVKPDNGRRKEEKKERG